MRSILLVAALVLPLLAKCNSSFGASLKRLELVADGSANPPGDRIDFTIQFDPDESVVEVSARGFRISGQRFEIATPVGDSSRKGVLARQMVPRDQGSFIRRGSLVIPYSDWKLTKGTHRIAYEFILSVNNRVEFVRPTPLTEVIITDETRREINVTETEFNKSIEARDSQFRIAGDLSSTDAKSTLIQTPVTEVITSSKATAAEIPGEFLRSQILVDPTAEPVAANDISSTDPETLANRWWRPLSEVESGKERRIWFATNRAPSDNDARKFTGEVAEQIQYGSCIVNIPVQNHRKGTLEMPSWWSKRDPHKHFTISEVQIFDQANFTEHIDEGDVLLFVHGFYNTFDDAIFRTSQLHHDLDFAGQSMAFSWPSAGSLSEYESDQKNADASVDALIEVITTVASTLQESNGRRAKIHVIAHSMGNRIVLQSLYKINQSRSDYFQQSPFGQIVLAAPDVGAIMFNNLSSHAVDLGEQVTYYYCESDAALNTSRMLNKYEPVGLLPYFDDGLFTINANGAGTSFIGHGYYASSREVLSDIELMLKHGSPPPERMPPLALETKVFGHKCWSFAETKVVARSEVK